MPKSAIEASPNGKMPKRRRTTREIPHTSAMRFAQRADALQIAECRRFEAGDLFWIEVKIGHSA